MTIGLAVGTAQVRLLLVVGDEHDGWRLRQLLEHGRLCPRVEEVNDHGGARRALAEWDPELVLLDRALPEGETLPLLAELERTAAVVVLLAEPDQEQALRWMRAGAQDVLVKGELDEERLERCLGFALERSRRARSRADEQAHQLAETCRELERLAAEAAHDLQEPVRTARTLGERLAARSRGLLDERGRECLDRLLGATGRMESMVRQILTLRRVSGAPVERQRVALGPLLETVRADVAGALEETGARLEVDPLPAVQGDETQLRRLFLNLLGNALKFVHPERIPHLRVRAVLSGPERVTIAIEDNGTGFSAQRASELFRPFRRLHSRDRGAGCGMGLAICQAIVEAHGGQISAHSAPGQGSTFTVILPLAAESVGRKRYAESRRLATAS